MDRQPAPKRPRLSMACNICRQRKVKCDADYPRCRNCRLRNQECVTSDPQRPGMSGVREWIEAPERGLMGSPEAVHTENNSASQTKGHDVVAEDSASEDSPVHHPFGTSSNVELGTNRMKIVGPSSSQCLAKSLDVYLKAEEQQPISGFFKFGMRHAEELDIPLHVQLPRLPGGEIREKYLAAYWSRIHISYPVFNESELRERLESLACLDNIDLVSRETVPSLVCVYLVMSLGADELSSTVTDDGTRFLHAAASLLSHIIVIPYLATMQALLLFTLAYRGRNQDGLAWQTVGMAIRVAYTLGIHRPPFLSTSLHESNSENAVLASQIWAVCCCLERILQLESGRPTAIATHAPGIGPDFIPPQHQFLKWHLQLADFQSCISQHIYNHGRRPRGVREILIDTARLDQGLLDWANQIPAELRPGNDIFCAQDEFHVVAFLSIQYHSTMIALHRAALIAAPSLFEAEVVRHCPNEPSHFRLQSGESICVKSARDIAKLCVEVSERRAESRLLTAGPPLLASIVLAIYLTKHPDSRLREVDLQLLQACIEFTTVQLSRSQADARFIQGICSIYERTYARMNYAVPKSNGNFATTMRTDEPMVQGLYTSAHQTHADITSSVGNVAGVYPTPDPPHIPPPRTPSMNINHAPTNETFLASNDVPIPTDSEFPFGGFDVEDLWNWMLSFEVPQGGFDGI